MDKAKVYGPEQASAKPPGMAASSENLVGGGGDVQVPATDEWAWLKDLAPFDEDAEAAALDRPKNDNREVPVID